MDSHVATGRKRLQTSIRYINLHVFSLAFIEIAHIQVYIYINLLDNSSALEILRMLLEADKEPSQRWQVRGYPYKLSSGNRDRKV